MDSDATAGTSTGESGESGIQVKVKVKFAGQTIPVSISPNSRIRELKEVLLPLTNVLPRGQKLIYKGRILGDESTLISEEITNGSKIMLMATAGLHQGDGPIKKEAGSSGIQRTVVVPEQKKETEILTVDKSRLNRWNVTGVIWLPEFNLKAIPEEVWLCEASARVLNLSRNLLQEIPYKINVLNSLQRLLLDSNKLLDDLISWEGIASLKSLHILSLQHNGIKALPSSLGGLTSLKKLDISHNEITCLPTEIGSLTNLEILEANNNRLVLITETFGECVSLVEVNLSSNILVGLPDTIGNLKNLMTLNLSNNGLRFLPSSLFKMCVQLSNLNLHGTQITTDMLRQFEGWEEFDERRRLKHNKKLEFRVLNSGEFDEGADNNR